MQLLLAQTHIQRQADRIKSLEENQAYLIRGNMGMHDWLASKIREIDSRFQVRVQEMKAREHKANRKKKR